MKRIISATLAVIMILTSVFVFNVSAATYTIGDINSDGYFNSKDSYLLSKIILGQHFIEDNRVADINSDGKIGSMDSLCLKKYIAGSYIIIQPEDDSEASIESYTVVYPEEATVYEVYAAEILCDWVADNCGVELEMVTDSAPETEYEILIGNTNRAASATEAVIENNQYLLKADGNKLVLQGKDYMIGGAVGELTYYHMNGSDIAIDTIPTEDTVYDYAPVEGDNIILMIGDGMGFNHIAFTQFYLRRDPTYEGFIAENFRNSGECITYCLSDPLSDYSFQKITTDSAAAATALSTGWKTQKGYLGLNGYDMEVKNIREVAYELGYKTAVVSTEEITGATPAGFTVHTDSRANNDEIIAQQTALVENGEITYLKGESYDELLSDTKTALDLVSTDSEGFFVMIEEAYIDKASHKLASEYTIGDLAAYVRRFNTAIQYAATFTASRPDTVLIVTADHETGSVTPTGGYDVSGNHTNVNVPVFAMGYETEYFNDTAVDNTDIADFMATIYGIESFGGHGYIINE